MRGALAEVEAHSEEQTGGANKRVFLSLCKLITVFDFLIAKWGLTEFVTECLTSFMTFALNVFHFFDSGLCLCVWCFFVVEV